MSVAVCRSPAAAAFQLPSWFAPAVPAEKDEDPPGQFDIWNSIQAEKEAKAAAAAASADAPLPYVHPLLRRSSSLMSQNSLEVCTEPLGSESGSDVIGFSSSLSDNTTCQAFTSDTEGMEKNLASESLPHEGPKTEDREAEAKELKSVNYHCSGSRRSPQRSFPPPLRSISRRDGRPCLKMRPHRRDGRLVVEAVPIPSHNYLHAQRQHGSLRLSFIDTCAALQGACCDQHGAAQVVENPSNQEPAAAEVKQGVEIKEAENEEEEKNYDEEEEPEEEEEEEVEVVDRGTVIEVKVTTQPQQQSSGGGTAAKVHRSSVVINKFVGGAPLTDQSTWSTKSTEEFEKDDGKDGKAKNCHVGYTTTTAAAAAVVAAATSSVGYDWCGKGSPPAPADGYEVATTEVKMLFTTTSRAGRSKEELLRHMRRCNQLRRRPLFIWEPCCIATSS